MHANAPQYTLARLPFYESHDGRLSPGRAERTADLSEPCLGARRRARAKARKPHNGARPGEGGCSFRVSYIVPAPRRVIIADAFARLSARGFAQGAQLSRAIVTAGARDLGSLGR